MSYTDEYGLETEEEEKSGLLGLFKFGGYTVLILGIVVVFLKATGNFDSVEKAAIGYCQQAGICTAPARKTKAASQPANSGPPPVITAYTEDQGGFKNLLLAKPIRLLLFDAIKGYDEDSGISIKTLKGTGNFRALVKDIFQSTTLNYKPHSNRKNGFFTQFIPKHLKVFAPGIRVKDVIDIYDPETQNVDIVFTHKGQEHHWHFHQPTKVVPDQFYIQLNTFIEANTSGTLLFLPADEGKLSIVYLPKSLAALLLEHQVLEPLK